MTFKLITTVRGIHGTTWVFQHGSDQHRLCFNFNGRHFEALFCPRGMKLCQPRPKLLNRLVALVPDSELAEAMAEAIRWSRQ